MTADFAQAVKLVLDCEGVFSNDVVDPGGMTKYGISKRAYPKLDIASLTVEQAKSIYLTDYWLRNRCGDMPWWAALAVFDCGVNQGVRPAAGLIQQTVGVFQDQNIGPFTLRAIEKADPLEAMATFQTLRAYRYLNTVNFDTYGRGWLRRLMKVSAHSMQQGTPNVSV